MCGKGMTKAGRKKNVAVRTVGWTRGSRGICEVMRAGGGARGARGVTGGGGAGVTGGAGAQPEARRTVEAIKRYMKHTAPVAPSVPHGLDHLPAPLVLWRGVQGQIDGDVIKSANDCFTAFSLQGYVAAMFARSGTLFRLQVDRVARGTPWVWFTDKGGDDRFWLPKAKRRQPGRTNMLGSLHANEEEVLLPPGFFKVLSRRKLPGITVLDVAYVPDPQYVRRGALPTVTPTGTAVTRTVAGHRLVVDHPDLTRTVRTRRARVKLAQAAASWVLPSMTPKTGTRTVKTKPVWYSQRSRR